MSSLCFWFVYFTLHAIYKVKAVFIMVLDRTTQIMATCLFRFTTNYKINISIIFSFLLVEKLFFPGSKFCSLNPKRELLDPIILGKVSKKHENQAKFDQVSKTSLYFNFFCYPETQKGLFHRF